MGTRGMSIMTLAIVTLSACGSDTSTFSDRDDGPNNVSMQNVIEVAATEYAYSMPDQATGGIVTFEMVNAGREPHLFTLVRLPGGRTVDDLLRALKRGGPPPWAKNTIGIAPLHPGHTVKTTWNVEEGNYAFVCALPSPKGPPHFLQGMIESFEVSGASEASFPEPDATIVATEEGIEVPSLVAGTQTIEFKNAGDKEHEFFLFALDPDKTERDVGAWFGKGQQGPPPVTFVGGFEAVPAGTSMFQEVRLEAGRTYTLSDAIGGHEATFTVS
jgi:hypothetical protein